MADEPYPLYRDYRLFELDGTNVRKITGLTYAGLRQFATAYGDSLLMDKFDRGESIRESMMAKNWDRVLKLDARTVWNWRRQNNMHRIVWRMLDEI